MAANLNRVLLIGNLTRDPELRYIPSGQAVTTFTLAVNRTYVASTGEKKEEANFIRIVVWAKRAEVCHEYLRKGSPVFVEGRLQSRSWDAPDGTKRSTIEVVAQNVQFLGRGSAKPAEPEEISERLPAGEEQIIDDTLSSEAKGGSVGASKPELPSGDEVPF
ncbi:MAG: single-stranded DNA-binding protein [Candidatus Omnitrophica bacterium]|nr:single-stranded DNA-binding protein [Candidatus Omnitrophota bacterium]